MFLCCKILKLISLAYAAVSYITPPLPLCQHHSLWPQFMDTWVRPENNLLSCLFLVCSVHVATWPGFSTIAVPQKAGQMYKLYFYGSPSRAGRSDKLKTGCCTRSNVQLDTLVLLGKWNMQDTTKYEFARLWYTYYLNQTRSLSTIYRYCFIVLVLILSMIKIFKQSERQTWLCRLCCWFW